MNHLDSLTYLVSFGSCSHKTCLPIQILYIHCWKSSHMIRCPCININKECCRTLAMHHVYYLNYPFIFNGSQGGGVYPSCHWARDGGTPWTGCQSFTGPHRDKQQWTLPLTPMLNLESLINLTCMFLDCGRKPEPPERTNTCTQKGPSSSPELVLQMNHYSFQLKNV